MSSDRPYGGVIKPKASVMMSTMPICTLLIDAWSVSWFTTGMKMMIAGIGSMKSPTMVNTATNRNMMAPGNDNDENVGDRAASGSGRRNPAGHDAAEQDHRDQGWQRRRARSRDKI